MHIQINGIKLRVFWKSGRVRRDGGELEGSRRISAIQTSFSFSNPEVTQSRFSFSKPVILIYSNPAILSFSHPDSFDIEYQSSSHFEFQSSRFV